MKSLLIRFQLKYQFSNYQTAQLEFLLKTMLSEMSKILLMGIVFHERLSLFLFALCILLCLRCSTGGLHFYTYLGCLCASMTYLGLVLIILPEITYTPNLRFCLLLFCGFLCYIIGPVPSKYRPLLPVEKSNRFRFFTSVFILIYSLILLIIPENPYIIAGFWTIILHSLQLWAAKFKRKEVD